MAVLLLWLLDISNNTAMEPFRAFIADTVPEHQQSTGFLMQSVFTGWVLPWPTFPSTSSSKSAGCNKLPKRVSRIGYSVPSILVRFALSVRFWLLFYRHPNASLVLRKWRLLRRNQVVRLMLLKILSLLYAKCRLPCGNWLWCISSNGTHSLSTGNIFPTVSSNPFGIRLLKIPKRIVKRLHGPVW